MGNWTAEGFVGQMFKTFARFLAPPGMPSPVLWGHEATVAERLASGLRSLHLSRVSYRFDYPFSPEGVVEFFRENYGPTTQAFAALSGADRAALREDLISLLAAPQSGQRTGSHRGRRRIPHGGRPGGFDLRRADRKAIEYASGRLFEAVGRSCAHTSRKVAGDRAVPSQVFGSRTAVPRGFGWSAKCDEMFQASLSMRFFERRRKDILTEGSRR